MCPGFQMPLKYFGNVNGDRSYGKVDKNEYSDGGLLLMSAFDSMTFAIFICSFCLNYCTKRNIFAL